MLCESKYLELESLSDLRVLNYEDEIELDEEWMLYKDDELEANDNDVVNLIKK